MVAGGWSVVACRCPAGGSSGPSSQATWSYELRRVLEVDGRQGVATDGDRYYVSGSAALYVYSKTGELLAANEKPFENLDTPANHMGDISVHDGEIYAGVESFIDGRATGIQVAIYDAGTLEYRRSMGWNADSGQMEISAVAVDPANSVVWMTDWVNGAFVYRYDLETGSYAGKLHLQPPPQWQQGIAVLDDSLYITADDGDAEVGEPDNLWRVTAEMEATTARVSHEKTFTEFRRPGEIEGLDFDRNARELIVLANRGKRIVLGMPKGLHPGYDREIHELYIYRMVTDG